MLRTARTLALVSLLGLPLSAVAVDITLSPVPVTVGVGESFSLNLNGEDFPTIVVGGGVELSFDATQLRLDRIVIDPMWEFVPIVGTINTGTPAGIFDASNFAAEFAAFNATGLVDAINFATFVNNPLGDVPIAVLTFTAVGAGSSQISLVEDDFNPIAAFDTTDPAMIPTAEIIAPGVTPFSASVDVLPVPEPETYLMLLAGLGLVGLRLRARAA